MTAYIKEQALDIDFNMNVSQQYLEQNIFMLPFI